jgi:hypothetical protein
MKELITFEKDEFYDKIFSLIKEFKWCQRIENNPDKSLILALRKTFIDIWDVKDDFATLQEKQKENFRERFLNIIEESKNIKV